MSSMEIARVACEKDLECHVLNSNHQASDSLWLFELPKDKSRVNLELI